MELNNINPTYFCEFKNGRCVLLLLKDDYELKNP
jgi:hypothetical protein